MITDRLLLYRNLTAEDEDLLFDTLYLHEHYLDEATPSKEKQALFSGCVSRLLSMGESYGFTGNLWDCFLAKILVNDENEYSKACEIRGEVEGSVNVVCLRDMEIFRELFALDFSEVSTYLGQDLWDLISDYTSVQERSFTYNRRIRDRICDLAVKLRAASSAEEMKKILTSFYKDYGVGKLGLHKAFRVEECEGEVKIVPITNIAHVKLDDLVGYELQKEMLRANTEAFLQRKKANNCLLYGDAGTGKSSSIKAIMNEYYDQGLRIIELYKHQFRDLQQVIAQIKNRNYRFIIYMDDLSFEEFETDYKYLKAVIEGGLERKPGNVLIYATSNRRHLVREISSDKADRDEDLHTNDTVQEKLSLAFRFGCQIYYGKPTPMEFRNIVTTLAERNGVDMPVEELLMEANKWELSHGGISGRTAQQFLDDLMGKR